MCGGADTPNYTSPKLGGYGVENLYKGKEQINQILNQRQNGLDPNVRNTYLNQGLGMLSGNYRQGLNDINSAFAGSGLSQGAKLSALTGLNQNQTKGQIGLNQNLTLMDEKAKADAFNQYMSMLGLGANVGNMRNSAKLTEAGMRNNFNMQKYQIDDNNSFKLGDFLGNLLGAGGSILGGMASGGTGFFK